MTVVVYYDRSIGEWISDRLSTLQIMWLLWEIQKNKSALVHCPNLHTIPIDIDLIIDDALDMCKRNEYFFTVRNRGKYIAMLLDGNYYY